MVSHTGHDGPYDAPFRTPARRVPAEWLDYNGHMNVAYYTKAFDEAIDLVLETELGVGETHVAAALQGPYALQANLTYLDEMLEGQAFRVAIRIMDADAKRMHLWMEMWRDEALVATCEEMLMNVDLTTRRSAAYPDWAQARIARAAADHAALPTPEGLGKPIGIRRKDG